MLLRSVAYEVLSAQVAEVRKMISERDDLLDASSGSGGKQVRKNLEQFSCLRLRMGDFSAHVHSFESRGKAKVLRAQ